MKLRKIKLPVVFAVLSLVFFCVFVVYGGSGTFLEKLGRNFVNKSSSTVDVPRATVDVPRRRYVGEDCPCLSVKDRLVRASEAIHNKTGLVLFTVMNDAYLEFAHSWLCNTEHLDDVHSHVLVTCTDQKTADVINARWPRVTAVNLNISGYSLTGDQSFAHVGYLRIMEQRTYFIQQLLERGMRVLLFEFDCVWMGNPLPLLKEKNQVDIVATAVHTGRTAGGFLLLNPSNRTVSLWGNLTVQMQQLWDRIKNKTRKDVIDFAHNDQEYVTNLIKKKHSGIKVEHLPITTFPDGQWYNLSPEKRSSQPRPYIVNNNWVPGNTRKKQRAKQWGHWFVNPDWKKGGPLCDAKVVKALFS